jgi:hypothetical protein
MLSVAPAPAATAMSLLLSSDKQYETQPAREPPNVEFGRDPHDLHIGPAEQHRHSACVVGVAAEIRIDMDTQRHLRSALGDQPAAITWKTG